MKKGEKCPVPVQSSTDNHYTRNFLGIFENSDTLTFKAACVLRERRGEISSVSVLLLFSGSPSFDSRSFEAGIANLSNPAASQGTCLLDHLLR